MVYLLLTEGIQMVHLLKEEGIEMVHIPFDGQTCRQADMSTALPTGHQTSTQTIFFLKKENPRWYLLQDEGQTETESSS